jgi:hypothetical protein
VEGFEIFTKYKTPSGKDMQVTIQKGGISITFNRAAFEALGSPTGVQLSYHRSRKIIGVLPVDLKTTLGTRVNRQGKTNSYYIAGRAFTNEYEIDTRIARRYKAILEGNMLMVNLNGPSAEVTGPRLQKGHKLSSTSAQQLPLKVPNTEQELKSEVDETLSKDITYMTVMNEIESTVQKAIKQGIPLDDIIKRVYPQ